MAAVMVHSPCLAVERPPIIYPSAPTAAAAGTQRLVIGLVGAMFIMLVELMVFVVRSLKADEVLETARQVCGKLDRGDGKTSLVPVHTIEAR